MRDAVLFADFIGKLKRSGQTNQAELARVRENCLDGKRNPGNRARSPQKHTLRALPVYVSDQTRAIHYATVLRTRRASRPLWADNPKCSAREFLIRGKPRSSRARNPDRRRAWIEMIAKPLFSKLSRQASTPERGKRSRKFRLRSRPLTAARLLQFPA